MQMPGNVKDLGAIGDGATHPLSDRFNDLSEARTVYPHVQSLTDEIDWAVIQATVHAGSTVFLPPGVYVLGQRSIDLDGTKHFSGAGIGATTLHYRGSDAAMRVNSGKGVKTAKWSVQGFSIDCQKTAPYGLRLGQLLVSPHSANTGLVESVHLTRATKAALHLVASQINLLRNVHCDRNIGDGCHVELLTEQNSNTDTYFFGCTFRFNDGRGLWSNGGVHMTFHGCTFERNGEEGVLLDKGPLLVATRNWTFDRCYFEANNEERGAANYGQFTVRSQVPQPWQSVELRRAHFSEPGDGNWNIHAGQVQLLVWYPDVLGSPIGTDTGASAGYVSIWDDSPPDALTIGGWVIGGAASRIVYHQVNRAGEDALWFNDGGIFRSVLFLTKDGALSDLEIADPARGVVLRAPGGTRYRITVDNTGALQTNPA